MCQLLTHVCPRIAEQYKLVPCWLAIWLAEMTNRGHMPRSLFAVKALWEIPKYVYLLNNFICYIFVCSPIRLLVCLFICSLVRLFMFIF